MGDVVKAGETVSTGAGSNVVLRFDDGQIVALSANSSMTVSTYTFNRQAGSGMSCCRSSAEACARLRVDREELAPSGRVSRGERHDRIRGTDTDVIVGPAGVVATVNDGSISFAMPGQPAVVISAGEAIHARPDGTFSRGAIQQIASQLAQTPQGSRSWTH
jgi:hypothetical protein